MTMNNKVFELFNFCGENHIDFSYETGENGINQITHSFNEKQRSVSIKICNPEDKNLDKLIDDKITELKNLIQ